jgi:hypothetical protein
MCIRIFNFHSLWTCKEIQILVDPFRALFILDLFCHVPKKVQISLVENLWRRTIFGFWFVKSLTCSRSFVHSNLEREFSHLWKNMHWNFKFLLFVFLRFLPFWCRSSFDRTFWSLKSNSFSGCDGFFSFKQVFLRLN